MLKSSPKLASPWLNTLLIYFRRGTVWRGCSARHTRSMDTPIKITRQRGNEVSRVTNVSFLQTLSIHKDKTVPDPNLEIRWGGGIVSKKIFSAFWASVWSKNKEGAGPPVPSPGSATARKGIEIYKNDHHSVTYAKTIALIFKQTLNQYGEFVRG